MSVESLTKEITTIDEFGFEFRPWHHWLPESAEEELKRLNYNLHLFEIGVAHGKRYPEEVSEARENDFDRVIELSGESHKSIPKHLYL